MRAISASFAAVLAIIALLQFAHAMEGVPTGKLPDAAKAHGA